MSREKPYQGLLGRLGQALVILVGVALLTHTLNFTVLSRNADPARQLLGQRADELTLRKVRQELGLHLPWYLQLFRSLNDLFPLSIHTTNPGSPFYYNAAQYSGLTFCWQHGCLALKWPYAGFSYPHGLPVHRVIQRAIPHTILLALAALFIGLVLGLPLGFWAALRQGKPLDHFLIAASTLGVSAPSFVMALLAAYTFGYWLHDWTGLQVQGNFFTPHPEGKGWLWTPQNLLLPALVLGVRPLASVFSVVRTTVLEARSSDYVRTAQAKGLPPIVIYHIHIFRNILFPIISLSGNWLAGLLGGAIFVEYVFGWNGVGKLMVEALEARDFPLVSGILIYMALALLFIHYITERLYKIIHPELRRS
ncbi:MAG: ABC transporter permease [Flavobacteriales bacterium]|nr:ABC transporter permease [Flavobacteriales bacterium]MCX7767896.1 ABC transporter permease [Flavobacteriales bacterium]MDW8409300.1 ABC transporter permease [Flavobacteriales bacterium]